MRGTTSSPKGEEKCCRISTHVPHAGHDINRSGVSIIRKNFNSRAPCGARLYPLRNLWVVLNISTHVPHAGHDRLALGRVILVCGISTHVPHAGHDGRDADKLRNAVDFNSRAPCGARPPRLRSSCPHTAISTHVPHAGHDEEAETKIRQVTNFNSRAPCGARPRNGKERGQSSHISTHVPHAGHDS